jgi:hypothetical protein
MNVCKQETEKINLAAFRARELDSDVFIEQKNIENVY